mmetsp:Transcript_65097/g.124150  ORF Transcript_65097/g.124150 Transcript_65097/m.124150 type:complete len:300 (-) Transcript_65097:151-1050(-)
MVLVASLTRTPRARSARFTLVADASSAPLNLPLKLLSESWALTAALDAAPASTPVEPSARSASVAAELARRANSPRVARLLKDVSMSVVTSAAALVKSSCNAARSFFKRRLTLVSLRASASPDRSAKSRSNAWNERSASSAALSKLSSSSLRACSASSSASSYLLANGPSLSTSVIGSVAAANLADAFDFTTAAAFDGAAAASSTAASAAPIETTSFRNASTEAITWAPASSLKIHSPWPLSFMKRTRTPRRRAFQEPKVCWIAAGLRIVSAEPTAISVGVCGTQSSNQNSASCQSKLR